MVPYLSVVCGHMKAFYDSLSEKDRRRYAAVESEKLGMGASSTLRLCWAVTRKRFGMAAMR